MRKLTAKRIKNAESIKPNGEEISFSKKTHETFNLGRLIYEKGFNNPFLNC